MNNLRINFSKALFLSTFLFVLIAVGSQDAQAYDLTLRPAGLGASHQYDAKLKSTWKKKKSKLREKLREKVRAEINRRGVNYQDCDLAFESYRYSSCNKSGKMCNYVYAEVLVNNYCADRM